MEERIIDDEYGRGIRLKKTADGYVDATDELAKQTDDEEAVDEVAFEFPVFETDEDDEELVGLSPEEVEKVLRERAEAEAIRKAEYERLVQEGEEFLQSDSFRSAELKFEKALALDEEATQASVGYWRAKTENFQKPDVLIQEYIEAGIETLEFDLGYQAVEIIRENYRGEIEKRYNELTAEEQPLAKRVEEKQQTRREAIAERLKKSGLHTGIAWIPTVALLVATIVLGLKIFSVKENTFVIPTIICAVAFFMSLIISVLFTNVFINDLRIRRTNERLSSTDEGARLEEIREYTDLYADLLQIKKDEE